ncbi:MAG TPA: hypothetical protein EYO59_04635 [Chromatiaceae bacterium]|jgi:hypothetical protein|nr:hypothetical protein [Chromatiaceae bacterium]
MKASKKSPAIDSILEAITGRNRMESILTLTCATCGNDAQNHAFRDTLSWKEFNISGMCQKCQDEVFGV